LIPELFHLGLNITPDWAYNNERNYRKKRKNEKSGTKADYWVNFSVFFGACHYIPWLLQYSIMHSNMEIVSNFAVFEGCDGSGTTTQLKLLEKNLGLLKKTSSAPLFFPTFEPTEGPAGRLIRQALKKDLVFLPETMARLFAADRTEHLYAPGGILERTRRGELVISDRYVLSSLVYQGIECGEELPASLNAQFPAPELLIFFDIDPEIARLRLQNRAALEIYEYLDFQKKVRSRYHALLESCRESGTRVEVLDASKTQEEVAEEVWRVLQKMPIFT
jgi:dTMP kinase